jgi:hypothetical protein
MARPAVTEIEHGQQSWDSDVNDNFAVLVDGPFPIYEVATVTALLAVNPASYDRCLVVTTDTSELWISDGTDWRLFGTGDLNANGARGRLRVATTLLALPSGGSQTWAGAKPAGARLVGVSGRVTTAITGPASVNIGDGTDADRFAAALALTLGTTFTPANATADPGGWTAAAGDVVVTAVGGGGAFTAGAIRLVALYEELTAPTS